MSDEDLRAELDPLRVENATRIIPKTGVRLYGLIAYYQTRV